MKVLKKYFFLKKQKLIKEEFIFKSRLKFLIFLIMCLTFILMISFKSGRSSCNKTDKIGINYLRRKYGKFLNDLPKYEHSYITNKTIFWCWLKGLNNISKIGLSSLNSIKKNLKDYNIIIINETNINKYVNIPKFIMDKYEKGQFTPTHFSDILRLELLNTYGGTWIDASVLITEYSNLIIFFVKYKNKKRIIF